MWAIGLALVAALTVLPFLSGGSSSSPSSSVVTETESPEVAASVGPDRVPSSSGSDRLLTGPALRRGPQLTWQEWNLPDNVTTVHAVGEMDGLVWVVAGTAEPDVRGIHTGATVFAGDGSAWDEHWVLAADHVVIAAHVSSGGIAIVSTVTTLAGRLPFVASDLVAHASPDGDVWTSTELETGGAAVTNIGVVAGSPEVGAWVHGVATAAAQPDVLSNLPGPIADLVRGRAATVHTTEDDIVVEGAFGFELYSAAGAFEAPPASVPPTLRTAALWRSERYRGFGRVEERPDDLVIDVTAGVEGQLVATTANRTILSSTDGQTWIPVAETAGGAGQPVVQSVGGVPLTLYDDRIQVLSTEGIEDIVVDFPGGARFSANVAPAAGPAGLAVLTASDGPNISIAAGVASFSTSSADFEFDRANQLIRVTPLGSSPEGSVIEIHAPSEDVALDVQTAELVIRDIWRVPVAALERGYLAATGLESGGPFGVAFSHNGLAWGWSPISDGRGEPAGPISHLSVGETRVYAVVDLPQFPTAPRTITDLTPRLLVGDID